MLTREEFALIDFLNDRCVEPMFFEAIVDYVVQRGREAQPDEAEPEAVAPWAPAVGDRVRIMRGRGGHGVVERIDRDCIYVRQPLGTNPYAIDILEPWPEAVKIDQPTTEPPWRPNVGDRVVDRGEPGVSNGLGLSIVESFGCLRYVVRKVGFERRRGCLLESLVAAPAEPDGPAADTSSGRWPPGCGDVIMFKIGGSLALIKGTNHDRGKHTFTIVNSAAQVIEGVSLDDIRPAVSRVLVGITREGPTADQMLDWLDRQGESFGFNHRSEGWTVDYSNRDDYLARRCPSARDAIRTAMAAEVS